MLVVAAVIEQQGRFLLARRAPHKGDAGYWEFPGGKVEDGESPQEALARELLEELGIVARVGGLVHQSVGEGRTRLQAYAVQIDGAPCLRDHDRIDWVDPARLGHYLMHECDHEVARLLKAAS